MAIGQEKTKIIKVCINIEYKKYIVRTVNRYIINRILFQVAIARGAKKVAV